MRKESGFQEKNSLENNESESGGKKSLIEALDDAIDILRKIRLEFGKPKAEPPDVSMRRIRDAYSEMVKILDEAKKPKK